MFVDKVFLFNCKMYGKYNIYTFCLFCHFMYKCSNTFQEGLAGNSSKNTEGKKCDESSDDKWGTKILKEKQKENYQNKFIFIAINRYFFHIKYSANQESKLVKDICVENKLYN